MIVGAGIGAALVLAILLAALCVKRARSKPAQLLDSGERTALLLAEKEVESLLAEEDVRPDVLPFGMLSRRIRHHRDSEVIWTCRDNIKADIHGHLFLNPDGPIYEHSIQGYAKVIFHDNKVMVEIPSYASFSVQDQIPEDFTKADLVSIVRAKRPAYYGP